MKINEKILIQRKRNRLTQQQLADKVQVSRQTINNIEQGRYMPRLTILIKIAEVLQVPVSDFLR